MPYLQGGELQAAGLGAWLGIVGITAGVALVGPAHKGHTPHHGQALGA